MQLWYRDAAAWLYVAAQADGEGEGAEGAASVGLGQLGAAVKPPSGAPKLKKLIMRDNRFRITPDGCVELTDEARRALRPAAVVSVKVSAVVEEAETAAVQ